MTFDHSFCFSGISRKCKTKAMRITAPLRLAKGFGNNRPEGRRDNQKQSKKGSVVDASTTSTFLKIMY